MKRHRKLKEKTGRSYRIAVVIVVAIGVIGSAMYMGWVKSTTVAKQDFAAKVSTWWTEHRARITTKLASSSEKMRQVAAVPKAKSSTPEPVHFEFYNMLSNNDTTDTESTPSIFNHDNLEREFAKTVEKTAYVLQAGHYKSATLADKARATLVEDGLVAKVIKGYREERLVYRVQVGPYQEKDQINNAQSKLAARGIHAVLRKSEEKIA